MFDCTQEIMRTARKNSQGEFRDGQLTQSGLNFSPGRLQFMMLQHGKLSGPPFRINGQRNVLCSWDKRHWHVGQAIVGKDFEAHAVTVNSQARFSVATLKWNVMLVYDQLPLHGIKTDGGASHGEDEASGVPWIKFGTQFHAFGF